MKLAEKLIGKPRKLDDFVYIENDWFRKKYAKKSRGRFLTFKIALNWFYQHGGKNIVETGTTKEFDDWGAGMSTVLFAEVIEKYGGELWTIDNSKDAIEMCKAITAEWADRITYLHRDSVFVLREFRRKIDLLYLDSMDCPIDPKKDPRPPQMHQLREIQAAYSKLHDNSIVLLDDNDFLNGGKTRLSKRWLEKQGWTCLLDSQQTVWVKK